MLIFVLSNAIEIANFVQADSPITLSVNLITYQGTVSTVNNYLVVAATVMASGSPVSGASVAFSDIRNSAFNGQTANTNSSGVALTTVQFNNGWTSGIDIITASATAIGYNSNTGSVNVTVLPGSGTQLYVTASLVNKIVTGGSTNVISGTVADYNGVVQGATVTISDKMGSTFSDTIIFTNSNGFFSTNFTVASIGASANDLVTVGVASNGFSPSQSTIIMQINPCSSNDLTVTMNTFQPSTTSTPQNFMVIAATVSADGIPVPSVSVAFSDSRGSTFNGQTANTNSSGIALTTVQFNNGWNSGIDTITGSASATGYSTSVGSNIVTLLPGSGTQLYVTPSLANKIATSGSTDVISGTVAFYGGNAQAATVTISDTIGSTFSNATVLTNSNGVFSTNFTIANIGTSVIDLVTVGVASNGYSSSQSTITMQVNPYNASDLTVTMNSFYPSTISTPQNFMVMEATVSAGGTPTSGALVSFSDSRGSTFNGQTANTNSSGIALTTIQFNNGWNSGIDTITASATATGYSGSAGSNIVTLLPGSGTQLYVTPSLANKIVTGGSTDIISGTTAFNGGNAQGATVTFSDTLGSIFNVTIVPTDKNGYFSASFVTPSVASTSGDIITVSASEPSYSSSSSALYLQVNPVTASSTTPTPLSAPPTSAPTPTPTIPRITTPTLTASPTLTTTSTPAPHTSLTPTGQSSQNQPTNFNNEILIISSIVIIGLVLLGITNAALHRRKGNGTIPPIARTKTFAERSKEQVFIGYVDEDKKIVEQLADQLEQAGYKVWYYTRDNLPGSNYMETDAKAIDNSQAVIIVVSRDSIKSNQVKKEVYYSHDQSKTFFPILYGMTYEDLKEKQKDWMIAFGPATSIEIHGHDIAAAIPKLIQGLDNIDSKTK